MIVNKYIIILIAVCCFGLGGCSPLNLPPDNKYTLMNFKQPVKDYKAKSNLSILVATPTANPGYETDKIIYMKVPLRLQSYSKNRWVAPPNQMLLPILVNAMRRTHYFHAVVSSPFSGITNYRLNTRILVLQQEFLHPISQVRLSIQATVINSKNNSVVATQVFSGIQKASMNDPYSGVLAARQLVNRLSNQIAKFVTQAVR